MTKSLTINIGGQLFEIEAKAYEQLRQYINTLENHFKNDPDGKEIVDDLELRIAELFIQLQTKDFKTILKEQVEFVQLKMGTVDEFEPIDETYTDQQETTQAPSATKINTNKKLMRDTDDRVLGGVCAGFGHYFNINPIVLRIALLILFFGLGFGLLIYLLLWIVIPKAHSTTDKLMMRGQPINLNTVADSVKEENLRQSSKTANPLIHFVGQLMNYFAKFLFAAGKVLLIIVSFALLSVAVAGIMAVGFGLLKSGIFTQSLSVSSAPVFGLVKLMAFLAFGVPVLLLIIGLIYLLLNRNYFKASFALPLLGIWLVSVFLLTMYGKRVATDFEEESTTKEIFDLAVFSGDTLYVGILESAVNTATSSNNINFSITSGSLFYMSGTIYIDDVALDIKPSNNDQFRLIVEKNARGKSKRQAADRATQTNYVWKHDNDHLLFNTFFGIDKNTKWRMQKVALTLQVPIGRYLHLGHNTDELLENIDNAQDMYDSEMVDKMWKMTSIGLTCFSCDSE